MSLKRADVGLAREASAIMDKIQQAGKGDAPAEAISQLKRLPALLQTSGVPATIAFLYSKAGDERPLDRAYRSILDALLEKLAIEWGWTDKKPDAVTFFAQMAELDPAALSRASLRLQGLALWLRRLAEALEHAGKAAKARR